MGRKFDRNKFECLSDELTFNEIYLKSGGYNIEYDHCHLEEYLKNSMFSEKYKKKFWKLWVDHSNEHYEEFFNKHYKEIKRQINDGRNE